MGNHITIFSTYFDEPIATQKLDFYAAQLPEIEQKKINAFVRWEDRTASILGKALLLRLLQHLGESGIKLSDLLYTSYNRPYFDANIDFSIAHSGSYVICAMATHCRLGIDIEQIKTTANHSLGFTLTPAEERYIQSSIHADSAFYNIWTKKEAILKADGRGLGLELSQVDTTCLPFSLEGETWFTQSISINEAYAANIAFNHQSSIITHNKIFF
jgi:4'-phosphopantetheinyl transferase